MAYHMIQNHPAELELVVNSDETLLVSVSRAGCDDKNRVRFAGYIKPEDSKIMKRSNRCTIKSIWKEGPWLVIEYNEYELDEEMMYVELVAVLHSFHA
jgi:hypothetical protein